MGDFSSSAGAGGHTIIPPTRRPDGSLRKPIRVRAGYVPQDEIGAWESPVKRMQREREAAGVPGWVDSSPTPAFGASSTSSSYTSTPTSSRGIVGGEGIISSSSAPLSKSQKRNLARKKTREEKRNATQGDASAEVDGASAAMAKMTISSRGGQAGKKAPESSKKAPESSKKTESRSPAATQASSSAVPTSVDELKKKIKALQKKLRQGVQLQAKIDAGEITPTEEQLQKIKKLPQFEKELQQLQTALDATAQ